MIGALSPGSQTQIVSPNAASSEAAASTGRTACCTTRGRKSPAISTIIDPPLVAKIGDRPL
jgi:hypothetical protein